MKLAIWVGAGFAVVLIGVVGVLSLPTMTTTFRVDAGTCRVNEGIPPNVHSEIAAAATQFLTLLVQSPAKARDSLSKDGRAAIPPGALEAVATQVQSFQAVSPPAVTETYLMQSGMGSRTFTPTPCGAKGGGLVFVGIGGTRESAVVLATQQLPGKSGATTAVLLEHESNQWRIRAFQIALSTIAGLDAAQMWKAGQDQRAKGLLFNATMLYSSAQSAQYFAQIYQPHMRQDFMADLQKLEVTPLARGALPFHWKFGKDDFPVSSVVYSGTRDATVTLVISHDAAWKTEDEAEAINHRLIEGFDAACPEWREIFAKVSARVTKTGTTQGWGTVFHRETGYVKYVPPSQPAPQ